MQHHDVLMDDPFTNGSSDRINYCKKCPKCDELNEENAHWCMQCGKAILSVEIRRCDSFHEVPRDRNLSKSLPLDSCLSVPNVPTFGNSEGEMGGGTTRARFLESGCGIRRCESFHSTRDNLTVTVSPFQRSVSQPKDVFGGDLSEEHFATSFANLHLVPGVGLPVEENVDSSYSNINPPLPLHTDDFKFTEYWGPYERGQTERNTAIYKRNVQDEKTQELPYFYAFDDSLYPHYAMDDPVMGYVLPSSNIVSNMRNPYFLQNCPVESEVTSPLCEMNFPEKQFPHPAPKKRGGRWRRSKGKFSTLVSRSKDKMSSHLDLPEELILYIFSFLNNSNLATCARVCKQFRRIASDESIWTTVVLKRKHNINDRILSKIARKHLSSLTITQCNGKSISAAGVDNLLRVCSQSLRILDVSGTTCGVFAGEAFIINVAEHCNGIHSLDVSWSNVGNSGVEAIAAASNRLVRLAINGCQAVTDEAVNFVTEKHYATLEVLELFGCFNITPASINIIAQKCKQITVLNLGQCHKVSNASLCNIAKGLLKLENLDIRGCKQVRDSSLREIIMNCQWLSTLVIANCPYLTDSTLVTLAAVCLQLKSLDVCGIGKVSDRGVETLARRCRQLRSLDLSSTKATGRSVVAIANNCREELESLKLSFCHSITDSCLNLLVNNCKKLKSLHLYGCRSLHHLAKLMERNPELKIEKESIR